MNLSALKAFKNQIKASAVCIFALALLAIFLKNPSLTAMAAASSAAKCGSMLIPSLFPLMAASEIAVASGAAERLIRPISKGISKIIGIKKEAAAPLVLGFFCGYTASVSGALSLLKTRKITEKDCERIIFLSALPSLPFVTGFLGSSVLKNTTDGWILWVISLVSSLFIGLLTKSKNHEASAKLKVKSDLSIKPPKKSLSKIIVGAISHASESMILICACVIFFSVLTEALGQILDTVYISEIIQKLLLGTLEITGGVLSTAHITPYALKCTACAFLLGWSGLSIHFQIIALCDGYNLSFKKYFLIKAVQGVLCAALAFVIFGLGF